MDDITMLINKIDELKEDNSKDHSEIKETLRCLPCSIHDIKIAKLEALQGVATSQDSTQKKSKLDDIVTKRVMYIFGGVIAGIVLLLKEMPNIIKAFVSLSGKGG